MDSITRLDKSQVKALNFEEAYERLNETAGKLERGNLSLEDSLALYEEGVLLSQRCEELLNKAELRVSQITPAQASQLYDAAALEGEGEDDEDEDYLEADSDDDDDGDITMDDLKQLKF